MKHHAALKAVILRLCPKTPRAIHLKFTPHSAETREPAGACAGISAVCTACLSTVLLLSIPTSAYSQLAPGQLQPQTQYETADTHCVTPVVPATVDPLTGTELKFTDATATEFFPDDSLQGTVELSADSANNDPEDPQVILLNGTISIRHRDGALTAENAQYDARTNIATVDGDMSYRSAGLEVESSDATLNVARGTFELGESGYELGSGEVVAQGRARRIARDDTGTLRLKDATYTSCPPGDNGWLISADSIKLDTEAGIGTAQDITLRFKDVPIFYSPAFSFPINDQRKTGLLAPRVNQSDETGLEYRQPFYWNIRPDTDATFTLRTMSDRGVQLQSELRHLNRIGLWTLNHEFIDDDSRFIPGENRSFARLRHMGGFSDRWTTSVDLNNVSDKDYFEDLGDTLNIAGVTHLERRADITYTADDYVFRSRFLTYQTVDEEIIPEDRPYRQTPQFTLNYKKYFAEASVNAAVDTEWVFFDRADSVTGSRLDVNPRIEWNRTRTSWYSTLAGGVRYTSYNLNNSVTESRTVPVFSTDVGMFFDRVNNDGSTLTLEPRLFYLFARRTDQDELPVFDTGALDFNFEQLFRENSFSGADRINDANQLSFALSSSMLDAEGRQKFQASIGQTLFFQDRTVQLPDSEVETASSSDIVGELSIAFDKNWSGQSALQWNPNTSTTERSSAELRYRDGRDRLFNIGHRFIRDVGETVNASFAWPIKNNWRVAAGVNYSLDDDLAIESVFGLEYESCCWAFRTAARRFITENGEDTNTPFFFQLVLKGLAPVGQNVTEVLRESVGGYTASEE